MSSLATAAHLVVALRSVALARPTGSGGYSAGAVAQHPSCALVAPRLLIGSWLPVVAADPVTTPGSVDRPAELALGRPGRATTAERRPIPRSIDAAVVVVVLVQQVERAETLRLERVALGPRRPSLVRPSPMPVAAVRWGSATSVQVEPAEVALGAMEGRVPLAPTASVAVVVVGSTRPRLAAQVVQVSSSSGT